jgi:glutamyl-Q tRNA(Asp) synthetase
MNHTITPYIGRFAPSPSGLLHFGSLIAALASYLDAKHHHGQWLVRMEDIDPPREEKGAAEGILYALQAHHLFWDGDVMYQSQRLGAYNDALNTLKDDTYYCRCGRQQLLELRGIYDGRCRQKNITPSDDVMTSTRIRLDTLDAHQLSVAEYYQDLFQGEQQQSLHKEVGDFILRRKDNLFAYQLAVVCDDITQGVTHIIRGSDLLSSTPRQRYLTQRLTQTTGIDYQLPQYGHIPVASNKLQQKLSKQHKAQAIDNNNAFNNLCRALTFLHHAPPKEIVTQTDIPQLLTWATHHWERKNIPRALSFVVEE